MEKIQDYKPWAEVNERLRQLRAELSKLARERADIEKQLYAPRQEAKSAWSLVNDDEHNELAGQTRTALQTRLQQIEDRTTFLNAAILGGDIALRTHITHASVAPCVELRPQFAAAAAEILDCLKRIDEANSRMWRLRQQIEDAGFRSSDLPVVSFDVGGSWDDPHGGRVAAYRKWVAEAFPEISKRQRKVS